MIKIGDIISNRYNVLSHLGTGGMAVVFECKDLYSGNIVALKILKEECLADKQNVESFTKEVKAAVSMSHPNIVEVYEQGVFENRPYLVMEFLRDQTLLDKLEYFAKFSKREACQIMIQLLDAVSYTHKHSIIHRDIKPQNLFYLPNGTIKLGDFGIAKTTEEYEKNNRLMGSVHYLAPEVLVGKPFSIASDIYASGVTFYQLLTGILPFEGSTKEVADAQIKKPFPNAGLINAEVDENLDEIIQKATEKNPKNRYKNAEEFKEAILAYLEGRKIKKSFWSRLF